MNLVKFCVGGISIGIMFFCWNQFQVMKKNLDEMQQKYDLLQRKYTAERNAVREKYSRVDYALNNNEKLRECFSHPRKLEFLKRGGEYIPDYERPRTLNDKVGYILDNYFLKSPITSVIGTKYFAKKYVEDKVGKKHVVKLLGVYDNPEDINWNELPKTFVLKSVRGNFGREVIIVRDKDTVDRADIVRQLNKFCESPVMKSIHKKRIIAEEFLEPSDPLLVDYKFFYSYGKPIVAYCLAKEKYGDTDVALKTFAFYTVPQWKRLPIVVGGAKSNDIPKPKHFKEMLKLSEKLSKDFPLIRIDLYEVNNRVLVGELTEDASGAKSIFDKVEWDFKIGDMISVPNLGEIQKLIDRDKEISKKYLED